MAIERTFSIIKPDATKRNLTGKVNAIIENAGTAKTTLYKLFGSKDGLVEAVLAREGAEWRSWFLDAIDGPGGSARDR